MDDRLLIYKGIKNLIYKYNLVFKSSKDYEDFIKELAMILDV